MFGPLELLLLLAIVLLLFGARRLPSLGRDLGAGMREFKDGIVHPSSDPEAIRDAPPAVGAPANRSEAPPVRETSET
jgi:sec-independent protein translocase protein TatA